MEPVNLDKLIDEIVERDPRYHREAYLFVREALDYTQKNLVRAGKEAARSETAPELPGGIRHVRGPELLDGIRAYGLQLYGPMTMLVFGEWGIQRCEDFGEIVFNMVESGLLAKTDQDTREDFKGGYEFSDAFRKPYLPQSLFPAPSAMPHPHPTPQTN